MLTFRSCLPANLARRATLFVLAGVAMVAWLPSIAAQSVEEVNRPVPDRFDALRVDGAVNVTVVQAPVVSITVVGPKAHVGRVTTTVQDATLHVAFATHSHGPHHVARMQVVVGVPTLKAMALHGAASVVSKAFSADALTVRLAGSGTLRLDGLDLQSLTLTVLGSGQAQLSGRAQTQTHSIRGSGKLHAGGLAGQAVSVASQGSGTADVGLSQSLAVTLQGSGHVRYRGTPRLTQTIQGTGRVAPAKVSRSVG